MRGRPLTMKCPRCKAGKHGFARAARGVAVMLGRDEQPLRRLPNFGFAQTRVRCRDCGHEWWSTIPPIPTPERLRLLRSWANQEE